VSEFTQKMPAYRLAQTHRGDDLQAVASRELGDANRWPQLVWINNLRHPYITGNDQLAGDGVLLAGSLIKVPSPVGFTADSPDRSAVYERDCALANKQLSDDGAGDLSVLTGADNLRQQLTHVIITPRGQARRHPEYGCRIWRLLGTVNGPAAGLMGAQYVKASLASDFRVARVDFSRAEVVGDAVRVTARAVAIDGGVVDVSLGED
jgi:phage baseplate assembly protein W